MLREFVEKNHCKFADSAKDWKEAIRMSCEVLEADGTVEENYKEDIIRCVEEYGPYIVIMPDVAMPHSQECAKGVHKTAIAFMKLEEPVSFDPGDRRADGRAEGGKKTGRSSCACREISGLRISISAEL